MKVIIELNDQPDGNVKIELSAEPKYEGEVSRALELACILTKAFTNTVRSLNKQGE